MKKAGQVLFSHDHARYEHTQGANHAGQHAHGVLDDRRQYDLKEKEGHANGHGKDVDVKKHLPKGDTAFPAHEDHAVGPDKNCWTALYMQA